MDDEDRELINNLRVKINLYGIIVQLFSATVVFILLLAWGAHVYLSWQFDSLKASNAYYYGQTKKLINEKVGVDS